MNQLDNFLMFLHPNKTLDEIKLDPTQFDKVKNTAPVGLLADQNKPKEEKEKPISRKEKRFNDRQAAKKHKNKPKSDLSINQILQTKLEKAKMETKTEISKRLDPIIFGN